jgi:hypothetical protein
VGVVEIAIAMQRKWMAVLVLENLKAVVLLEQVQQIRDMEVVEK